MLKKWDLQVIMWGTIMALMYNLMPQVFELSQFEKWRFGDIIIMRGASYQIAPARISKINGEKYSRIQFNYSGVQMLSQLGPFGEYVQTELDFVNSIWFESRHWRFVREWPKTTAFNRGWKTPYMHSSCCWDRLHRREDVPHGVCF